MFYRQQLIQLRIFHITIMFVTGVFIYQFSQWDDGLWIPISILAIVGPFRPGLSINKARQRLYGTFFGLLLSILVWFILRYNYNLMVIVALILVYCVAFCALQDYTYFIVFVTLMLCVNFDYMNLFINNQISFVVSRGICVLTGVAICQFYELFIFRRYYDNVTRLIDTQNFDALINQAWQQIKELTVKPNISIHDLNENLELISSHLAELNQLKKSYLESYSDPTKAVALIEKYEASLFCLNEWINRIGFTVTRAYLLNSRS